jgi:hypothetical protein
MTVINFTLVIQIIHFFIAFILIKYFFFKPAIGQLHADDAYQESLIAKVQNGHITIGHKEQALISQWQAMRAYFADHSPGLKPEPLVGDAKPKIVIPVLERAAIDHMAQTLSETVVKKVEHVS